jgi:hypothetical protein
MPRIMRQLEVAGAALLAIAITVVAPMRPVSAAPAVAASRAIDHVGEEVTIEGRVVASHASPLSTILGFAPNFAGFTATVLAADRSKFPPDMETRYRNKLVRVTGLVNSYRGKPEMRLRESSQLELVDAPDATPTPVAAAPSPAADATETARALAAIATRLEAIEARLAALERAAAVAGSPAPPPTAIDVGLTAAQVRSLFGEPRDIVPGPATAAPIWIYDANRSITFDRSGRVAGWTGF